MGATLLSAVAMVVADIAFCAIIALLIVIGALRGVSKSFNGFFFVIALILISLCLVGLTTESVYELDFVSSLETKLEETASGWGDVFTEPVYSNENGEYYIYDGAKLSEYGGIKGKFANFLAEKFMAPETEGNSLVGIAASMLTSVIVAAALFVIYCIALSLIKFVLTQITKGMHKSDSLLIKTFDRIFGALLSGALAFIFVLVVLAILKSVNVTSINEFINDSTICHYFFNNNPISQVFAKIFGA